MRAVVYDRYGPPDVLRLEDVEKPVPKEDEVLIKIHATTVNRLDCHSREANRRSGLALSLLSRYFTGFRRPKQRILGNELAERSKPLARPSASSRSVTRSLAGPGSGSGHTRSSPACGRALE
jgi:hypothetical protein